VCTALDQAKFLYLVSQQPAFALTIMHTLCQRIRERWKLYEGMLREKENLADLVGRGTEDKAEAAR
jgi:hypothetical protein